MAPTLQLFARDTPVPSLIVAVVCAGLLVTVLRVRLRSRHLSWQSLIVLTNQSFLQAITSPLNKVPGPLYARFTTLPLKLTVISGRRIHHVHALHEKYGPLVRISPTEVTVADVEAYKQIHGVGSGFQKSDWYRKLTLNEREGVFEMADQRAHAARRRLLSRPFSKTHLRQHWEPLIREKVELAISRVRDASGGGPVDLLKWFTLMASDVSTHVMFGEDFGTLESGETSEYIRTLQLALQGSGIGVEMPWIRSVGRRLPIRIFQQLWNTTGILKEYGSLAVTNMKNQGVNKNIFANMTAEAEKRERLDDEDIRSEAQNLIVAGTDTTSTTLTYLVWAVLSEPTLQQRIEQEVANLPGDYTDIDLEGLELLSSVIQETLRLYGAAPGALPRVVPSGGVVIRDVFIPAGCTVSTQAYTYHRDPALFADPMRFEPRRWYEGMGSRWKLSSTAKAAFQPFGSGARSCLGLHLAYMELRLASAEFFRRCAGARLAPSTTPESMEMENYFLISPKAHKCLVCISGRETDGA